MCHNLKKKKNCFFVFIFHFIIFHNIVVVLLIYILALAHHYEARSIDANDDKASLSTKKSQATSNESFIGNAREAMRCAVDDNDEECTSLAALKRAHLREAMASHEETQRLQRMCRYLKVSFSYLHD